MLKSNKVEAYNVKPNLYKTNVSGSLLSDEAIEIQAKKMTTFPEMCYPNKMMEIQCGHKYNEGAKWARDILINQIECKPTINNSLPMYDVDELNEIVKLYNNSEIEDLYTFIIRVWNKAYFIGANEGMKSGSWCR